MKIYVFKILSIYTAKNKLSTHIGNCFVHVQKQIISKLLSLLETVKKMDSISKQILTCVHWACTYVATNCRYILCTCFVETGCALFTITTIVSIHYLIVLFNHKEVMCHEIYTCCVGILTI